MKTDISGIGNALMDVLVKSSDEEFYTKHEVPKGTMILTDDNKWQAIYKNLVFDSEEIMTGGSAANTIATCAILGCNSALQAKVGNDEMGQKYRELYAKLCPQSNIVNSETGITGKCLSVISKDAERTMVTDLGCSNTFAKSELNSELISGSQIFHITGYLLSGGEIVDTTFAALDVAKQNGVTISFDVSDVFVIEAFRDNVERVIKDYADIVFANEAEATALSGSIDSAKKYLRDNCRLAVIKFGGQGSVILEKDKEHQIDIYKVEAIDTTGAGDSYAGGILFGLVNNIGLDKAGKIASRVAAQVVSQTGAIIEAVDFDPLNLD